MNTLLMFFALPLATIILSAIFETFINCPFKVAGIAFSIYLITTFSLGGTIELLVAGIIYTILSLITALIINYIQNNNDDNEFNEFPRNRNCRRTR